MDSSIISRSPLPTPEPFTPAPPAALLHVGFSHDPDSVPAALLGMPAPSCFVADVHGGGEAALALLAAGARRVVVAPQFDPAGFAAVLGLKVAGLRRLDRLDYLRLLGLLRAGRRERDDLYFQVRSALDPAARRFWDLHREPLQSGLFTNTLEVTLGRLLRNLLGDHLTPAAYRDLLYGDRPTRLRVFDERIAHSRFWGTALRLCSVRNRITGPAEPYVNELCANPVEGLRAMVEVGVATSPVWARAFCNDAGVLATLPFHLSGLGHPRLVAALDRLDIREVAPLRVLSGAEEFFEGFELGNLPDYLGPDETERAFRAIERIGRPGARLSFSTNQPEPERPSPAAFRRAPEVEAAVLVADRAPIQGERFVFVRS